MHAVGLCLGHSCFLGSALGFHVTVVASRGPLQNLCKDAGASQSKLRITLDEREKAFKTLFARPLRSSPGADVESLDLPPPAPLKPAPSAKPVHDSSTAMLIPKFVCMERDNG